MVEKEKVKETLVVKELPVVQTKTGFGDNGEEYNLITIEEAIQEILETVREIKKVVGGA